MKSMQPFLYTGTSIQIPKNMNQRSHFSKTKTKFSTRTMNMMNHILTMVKVAKATYNQMKVKMSHILGILGKESQVGPIKLLRL